MKAWIAVVSGFALTFVSAAAAARGLGLAEARALWRAAGIASYRYEYRKYCECHPTEPATTITTVRDGKVVEVRYRAAGFDDVVLAPERIAWYWTIEDLFALVESARDNPSLRVDYDPEQGFPRRVYLDPDPVLEGDEIDLRVSSLVPLGR